MRPAPRTPTKTPAKASIAERFTTPRDIERSYSSVVYGRSGSGKTTFSSSMPKPLLLADVKDRGTDSISDVDGISVLSVKTWADFEDLYWFLSKDTKFKSVVIDTVSQLQDLAILEVNSNSKAGGWGTMTKQQWGEVASLLKTWLIRYRDLDKHVMFIAQDRVFNGDEESEDNGIDPQMGPRLMPSVASTINAGVDIVAHTFLRQHTEIQVVNKKRVQKRQIQYAMRVGPNPSFITKIRKPKKVVVPEFIVNPTYDQVIKLVRSK